ncbi:MAG TPA: hypothetical protein VK633_01835 [Verrucomicrobiae bacterium]|nr:hypothetical protein [Verrucomicrobiae bacterium]
MQSKVHASRSGQRGRIFSLHVLPLIVIVCSKEQLRDVALFHLKEAALSDAAFCFGVSRLSYASNVKSNTC